MISKILIIMERNVIRIIGGPMIPYCFLKGKKPYTMRN